MLITEILFQKGSYSLKNMLFCVASYERHSLAKQYNESSYYDSPLKCQDSQSFEKCRKRSVETAENVLTVGGSFAFNDSGQPLMAVQPLRQSVSEVPVFSLTRSPSLSRMWYSENGGYYAIGKSFQKSC